VIGQLDRPATIAELIDDLDPDGTVRRGHRKAEVNPPLSSPSHSSSDLLAKRVRGWIAAGPGSISGQGGHARAFEVAQGLVNGFELSPDTALGFMLSDFNPKCEPAWSLRELQHKIEEAQKKPCDKARGWLLNADRLLPYASAEFPPATSPTAGQQGTSEPDEPGDDAGDSLNECDDDPHRLARCILIGYRNRGRRTLVYWRGEFHQWGGCRYQTLAESEFRATINSVTHRELVALHRTRKAAFDPSSGDDPPKMPKVTRVLVGNVTAALEAFCILRNMTDAPAWIDNPGPDPRDLVAAGNGLVHLPAYAAGSAEAVIENTPHYLNFNAVGFAADATAPEPKEWLAFLHTLWADDAESIELLQEWFGYLLTPDTRQQKMLLMVGPPRSGKGTIARVLQELVGLDNCCNPTLGVLGTPFGLSSLVGKSVAVIEDARLSARSDAGVVTERLLTISGEGRIDVDRKHRDIITGRLNTRFVVATNELPRLSDASGALARRWCVLKLTKSFLGKEDMTLADRLASELSGIFNWAVAGWKRLRERGRFTIPASVADLVDDLCAVSSPVSEFVHDRCWTGAGSSFQVDVEELYKEWKQWCEATGRKEPGTINRFGIELRSAVPHITKPKIKLKDGSRIHVYRGLRLKAFDELEHPEPNSLLSSSIYLGHHGHDDLPLHAITNQEAESRIENTVAGHHDRGDPNRRFSEGEL
jgi:putative DNA primase/helicase